MHTENAVWNAKPVRWNHSCVPWHAMRCFAPEPARQRPLAACLEGPLHRGRFFRKLATDSVAQIKTSSTLRASRAVPHPRTDRALRR